MFPDHFEMQQESERRYAAEEAATQDRIRRAVAAERERCASIAERAETGAPANDYDDLAAGMARRIAAAIRAGQVGNSQRDGG